MQWKDNFDHACINRPTRPSHDGNTVSHAGYLRCRAISPMEMVDAALLRDFLHVQLIANKFELLHSLPTVFKNNDLTRASNKVAHSAASIYLREYLAMLWRASKTLTTLTRKSWALVTRFRNSDRVSSMVDGSQKDVYYSISCRNSLPSPFVLVLREPSISRKRLVEAMRTIPHPSTIVIEDVNVLLDEERKTKDESLRSLQTKARL